MWPRGLLAEPPPRVAGHTCDGDEVATETRKAKAKEGDRRQKAGIEENQNAKRYHNWIRARADEMAAKRETTMSAREGPSCGGVNPMPETRVVDWILSDSDEGPSSGKEERAGEGAAKWASGLPHVCEHKCLATTRGVEGAAKMV
jgi:hypothetical protein